VSSSGKQKMALFVFEDKQYSCASLGTVTLGPGVQPELVIA